MIHDSLLVCGLRNKCVDELLDALEKLGYLIHVNQTPDGSIGFTYSSKMVKKLLTDPAAILRICLYQRIREYRFFDDLAVTREGILVMTKGFRTILAACCSDFREMQKIRLQLADLQDRIGIHAISVLISEMQKDSGDGRMFAENEPGNRRVYIVSPENAIALIERMIRDEI